MARFPPLDFLDTARTFAPCGMPRPKNPFFSNFETDKEYTLAWTSNHDGHAGGVRITLLDAQERSVARLLPMNGGVDDWKRLEDSASGPVPLTANITFPSSVLSECHQCTLLIERQASEYGATYIFHSCADVNIVPSGKLEESDEARCNGNGRWTGTACACSKFFEGRACQYRVDCHSDVDCGSAEERGRCRKEEQPSFAQKSCYCNYGYFGRHCESSFANEDSTDNCFNYENLVDSGSSPMFAKYGVFNPRCYDTKLLNDKGDDIIYSRVIGSEVEIIADFKTNGWLALGWRPQNLDPSCRLFPDIGLPRSRSYRQAESGIAKTNGFYSSALKAPLHGMDCVDIVSASVIDGRSKIRDMYSRDRSTPLEDTFFEGEMSLTAAYAIERDDRTVMMFRRNIREIEPSDHPLGPGKIFGVWAKAGASGSDGGADFFKYHARNRGVTVFDFVKPNDMPSKGNPLIYIAKHPNPSGVNAGGVPSPPATTSTPKPTPTTTTPEATTSTDESPIDDNSVFDHSSPVFKAFDQPEHTSASRLPGSITSVSRSPVASTPFNNEVDEATQQPPARIIAPNSAAFTVSIPQITVTALIAMLLSWF
uniref:DOMON domain-containing protein n=1 Tax=Panagrellus redivivus TaxID=6233 RepID=A0A7E4UZ10_PANRE